MFHRTWTAGAWLAASALMVPPSAAAAAEQGRRSSSEEVTEEVTADAPRRPVVGVTEVRAAPADAATTAIAQDGASDASATKDPAASDTAPVPPKKKKKKDETFTFGSYGRVGAGSDLKGHRGDQTRIIAHPPRLLEGPYAEIDFAYDHPTESDARFHTQLTLALGEKLFHLTGDFSADIAIRNLYMEGQNIVIKGLSAWAGSRMYRGDDVYLLDFWPVDEQNTVGGGLAYNYGATTVRLHAGMNRLSDKFQTQTVVVPGPVYGTRDIVYMDRQRSVVTMGAEHHLKLNDDWKLKLMVYGENQTLPSGYWRTEDFRDEYLPSDVGWLLGAEAVMYKPGTTNHANLFLRYATGLTAYDELGIPYGVDSEKKAAGARELLLGLAGNYEIEDMAGVLVGAYTRYFVDADPNIYDRDDAWEVGAAVRPAYYLTDNFFLIAEANVQYLRPNGLSPVSLEQDTPFAFQVGIMPTISFGKGSYTRPHLRLVYAMTMLNQAALDTYAPDDRLHDEQVRHYIGISTEWWFHSSRY